MSNLSEIRDLAHGLQYVIRHSKNRMLVKESVSKLLELRSSAIATQKRNQDEVVELIDGIVADGEKRIGFRPSDAAEYLVSETSDSLRILTVFIAYLAVIFAICSYIFLVNQTIQDRRFGKNWTILLDKTDLVGVNYW